MLVRGIGIRDISTVLKISITKVLKALKSTKSKKTHYDCLEKEKFWTYVGKKEQSAAYIRLSQRKWGNRSIEPKVRCMRKRGAEKGPKAEGEDKRAGDKL
jgi:hypothetical protein